jgi:predicted DNA-binding helix-hairpin-helix protein
LRNLHRFPVDINNADYEMILRIPGIGIQSAKKIVSARRFKKLGWEELRKLGVASSRAKHFSVCHGSVAMPKDVDEVKLRQQIIRQSKFGSNFSTQIALFP